MNEQIVANIKQFVNAKVPMIAATQMDIVEVDEQHCLIKIPLLAQNKNHLQSMYFGALAVGADCAGGLIALYHMMLMKADLAIVFKDFSANFLKRPEYDVYFRCDDGLVVQQQIEKVMASKERVSFPVHVQAYVEAPEGRVMVAEFKLTLSIK